MMREISTDVLVLGAGPAGSAAAHVLARRGLKVALVDRSDFPREKVCGDALIPDALGALRALGQESALRAEARFFDQIRIYAPNGKYVSLSGECACLPREGLDQIIKEGAVRAGASFMSPYTAMRAFGATRVEGAVLRHVTSRHELKVSATITLLATGAGIEGLTRFDVAERREPSAVALRSYFRVPPAVSRQFDYLCISYDHSIAPGYGWIFPGPDDVFNVGVGFFVDSNRHSKRPHLSGLWKSFAQDFSPARELIRASTQVSPLKGAPLRTAMAGSQFSKPGLLVIGEAAGLTYSFSGEGIGKAMASGMLAAELIASRWNDQQGFSEIGAAYGSRLLQEFGPRFQAYKLAQRWLESPRFGNFLAWRANRSHFVKNTLEGLFNETADPGSLFSVSGLVRSLLR